MISPIDRTSAMERTTLESGLTVFQCPQSGGYWIPADYYWRWQAMAEKRIDVGTYGDYDPVVDDTARPALICPESGALLTRYRVSQGTEFSIDRSPITGGVWLDSGEWEALVARNLHVEMHHIFTSAYQFRVRSSEFEQHLEAQFSKRIGEESFPKVKAFRDWMLAQESTRDILCYLEDGVTEQ
jgi:Zn-finger nucleic acid-binding protein